MANDVYWLDSACSLCGAERQKGAEFCACAQGHMLQKLADLERQLAGLQQIAKRIGVLEKALSDVQASFAQERQSGDSLRKKVSDLEQSRDLQRRKLTSLAEEVDRLKKRRSTDWPRLPYL